MTKIILNKTTGLVLCSAEHAGYFGLMLRKAQINQIITFPYEGIEVSGTQQFLMNYTIDTIWLDTNKKVVDIQRELVPAKMLDPSTWFHKPCSPAKYAIEISTKPINSQVHIGDELSW